MSTHSEQLNAIAEALSKFQGSVGPVIKNKEVCIPNRKPFYYADLTAIWDAIRKPMMEAGLSVTQVFSEGAAGYQLITMLSHTSGQWIKSITPIKFGADAKDVGKDITYYKRYAISAILGISSEDDEDDLPANADIRDRKKGEDKIAPIPTVTISKDKAEQLRDMVNGCGVEFKTNFWKLVMKKCPGIKALEELPATLYEEMKRIVDAKQEDLKKSA